jgi:hypothetical protein
MDFSNRLFPILPAMADVLDHQQATDVNTVELLDSISPTLFSHDSLHTMVTQIERYEIDRVALEEFA